MKKPNEQHLMVEMCKALLPNLNWDSYSLVNMESIVNEWQKQSIYEKRWIITIEEKSECPEWFDKHLWHIHWYVEHHYEDRPIKDNAVTIIERRRKRRHKENGKVYISQIEWYKKFEWIFRSESEISFFK